MVGKVTIAAQPVQKEHFSLRSGIEITVTPNPPKLKPIAQPARTGPAPQSTMQRELTPVWEQKGWRPLTETPRIEMDLTPGQLAAIVLIAVCGAAILVSGGSAAPVMLPASIAIIATLSEGGEDNDGSSQ